MLGYHSQLKNVHEKVSIYLSVNSFKAAEKLLNDSLETFGEAANLYNLLGVVHHKQSKFSQAISAFLKALEQNPEFIEPALNLTIVYCDLGLYSQAESEYDKLSSLFSSNQSRRLPKVFLGRLANLHCKTAEYYEKAGMTIEAVQEYEKALGIFPKMPDKAYALAALEFELGYMNKSKARLLDITKHHNPSSMVFNLLGLISYREGDYEEADRYWLKSLTTSQNNRVSQSLIRCLKEMPRNSPSP